ncbi:MAG: GyrI-like domain-containing protein [Phycisphaerales bacterium]|nr:GyrI-like domain-containing protein [Phycisphaerales bacterium]
MLTMEIKDCPARRLAAMRHVGPYQQAGSTFRRLASWAMARGCFTPGVEMIGIYYDNPRTNPPEILRADACITAPAGFEGDVGAGVGVLDLPRGRYGVGVFRGPYQRLGEVYEWLFQTWMVESGCALDDRACYEIYLNDPGTTSPEDLLTAIHVPLRQDEG